MSGWFICLVLTALLLPTETLVVPPSPLTSSESESTIGPLGDFSSSLPSGKFCGGFPRSFRRGVRLEAELLKPCSSGFLFNGWMEDYHTDVILGEVLTTQIPGNHRYPDTLSIKVVDAPLGLVSSSSSSSHLAC